MPPIKNLQEEAKELSTTLKIEELGALRIVVLDYQSRESTALLKAPASPTAQDGGGLFNFANASIANAGAAETEARKKEKALQRRITIYLYERRYVLKVATFLVRASFTRDSPWKQVGSQLVEEMTVGDKDVVEAAITALRRRLLVDDCPQFIRRQMADESQDGDGILFDWEKHVSIV